jgi:ribose 5-phosphate isomerase B
LCRKKKEMKVAIASDHAGVEYKEKLVVYLKRKGITVKDFGPINKDSVDYPDYAHPLAESISKKETDVGVLLCGSGNGINMSANKHQKVRSALCWKKEIAELARLHNDANVIALPARFLSFDEAREIMDTFLNTSFEGGRHLRRVNKISYC